MKIATNFSIVYALNDIIETKDDLIKALMKERIEIPRILSLAEADNMLAVRVFLPPRALKPLLKVYARYLCRSSNQAYFIMAVLIC